MKEYRDQLSEEEGQSIRVDSLNGIGLNLPPGSRERYEWARKRAEARRAEPPSRSHERRIGGCRIVTIDLVQEGIHEVFLIRDVG